MAYSCRMDFAKTLSKEKNVHSSRGTGIANSSTNIPLRQTMRGREHLQLPPMQYLLEDQTRVHQLQRILLGKGRRTALAPRKKSRSFDTRLMIGGYLTKSALSPSSTMTHSKTRIYLRLKITPRSGNKGFAILGNRLILITALNLGVRSFRKIQVSQQIQLATTAVRKSMSPFRQRSRS